MPNTVGDLVLVYINKNPAFFARIEAIEPDVKPDWWQVKLLVLQLPLKTVVWILREAYINGGDFTMGGTPIRLERVESPEADLEPEPPENDTDDSSGGNKSGARVISLVDRRKR